MVFFMVSAAMNHTSGGNPHPGLSFLQFFFFYGFYNLCVFFVSKFVFTRQDTY